MRGGSEHYRTIEALEFSIDPRKKIIPMLDKLRRKRNIGSYDDYGLVSQGEADHCGKMAVRVRKEVEDWIRKTTRTRSLEMTFIFRKAVIPITSPAILNNGPPLLPGDIGVVSGRNLSPSSSSVRIPLTIPFETVDSRERVASGNHFYPT